MRKAGVYTVNSYAIAIAIARTLILLLSSNTLMIVLTTRRIRNTVLYNARRNFIPIAVSVSVV